MPPLRRSMSRIGEFVTSFFLSPAETQDIRQTQHLEERLASILQKHQNLEKRLYDYRENNEYLFEENTELHAQNARLSNLCKEQVECSRTIVVERDALRNDVHEARKAQQTDRAELSRLREEVRKWKQLVSSVSKVENQTVDDELQAAMDQLYYSIQDFAVKQFRGVRFDFDRLSKANKKWAHASIPHIEALPAALNLHAVISLVSKTVLVAYEPRCFFGLSPTHPIKDAADLADSFKDILIQQHGWLEMTRKMLVASNNIAVQRADSALTNGIVNEILKLLTSVTSVEWKAGWQSSLSKVAKNAIDLLMALRRQKATFKFELPPAINQQGRRSFQVDTMAAVGSGEEDEMLAGRPIAISVFPALLKFRDEADENEEVMTVISKAKVVPEEQAHPVQCPK